MRYAGRMEGILIREAREEDVAEILKLYRDAELGVENEFTVEQACAQLAVFRKYPSYRIFVAVEEGRVVGTYELLIMDNMAKGGRKSGVVEDVAVSPDYRGRGVGRALMMHARELCRQASCDKFVLSSNLKRTEAHLFYEALGFEKHGFSFHVQLE